MTDVKTILKVAAIALVLLTLIPTRAATAQDCTTEVYCTSAADRDVGSADNGDAETAPNAGTPAAPANQSGGPVSAPTGALPITGGDVVGMAVIGAVTIALGSALVHRSKHARPLI